MEPLFAKGVLGILTTVLRRSSFGEYFRFGSMHVFNARTALSRCNGHDLGSESQSILSYSSSPRPGACRYFRTCNSILFVPSTSPLIHGEYANTMCSLHPYDSQNSCTGPLLKCVPPSDMKTSDARNSWKIHSRVAMVVLELATILKACTHMCCKKVSK